MKKIFFFTLAFCSSIFAMLSQQQTPISAQQKTRAWSQQLEGPLMQTAQKCYEALLNVKENPNSNVNFAESLEKFSDEAQRTVQFCARWKKLWQIQWLSAAETQVRIAQTLVTIEAQKNSTNTISGKQIESILNHAIENQMRLQKFDELCKHFFPALN